jgi:hypothetical protein
MNIESVVRYLWFLLETCGLQWSCVWVRVSEVSGRERAHRAVKSNHWGAML